MASFGRRESVLYFVLINLINISYLVTAEEELKPVLLKKDEYFTLLESGESFLVNFVSPGCVKCNEFAPEYAEVARFLGTERKELNIKVYTEGDLVVIRKQGLRRLPSLYYVREKTPILYNGDMKANAVLEWVEETGSKFHQSLTDEDFEHLTQAATGATTGDWLVLFCDVQHSDCTVLIPLWESVAYRLQSSMNIAVVDTATNPGLAKRFKLQEAPSIHLFRHGKRYAYTLQTRDDTAILGFATNGYKQVSGVDVEAGPSPFDTLTENIADQLKEVLGTGHTPKIILVSIPVLFIFVFFLCCRQQRSGPTLPARSKKGV